MIINRKFIHKLFSLFPRKIAYLPYKYIMLGRKFNEWFDLLNQNEKKSVEEIKKYQFRAIKQLLLKAYTGSSFYRNKYDAANFNPDKFRSLDDVPRIPVLTRDEVAEHGKEMILKGVNPLTLFSTHTAGTTGNPLELYENIGSRMREIASVYYIWKFMGYNPGDWIVEFRGPVNKEMLFEPYPELGRLRINVNRINSETIEEINGAIKKSGYRFFNGYPSAIAKYSKELALSGISPPAAISGISLASEMIYDWQVSTIEKVFPKARIVSFYALAENIALAIREKDDDAYRFIPTYSLVEKDKETGALIGTSFVNMAMPIIRYKTSDILSEEIDPFDMESSKTFFPAFRNIEGRKEDLLTKQNGELISPARFTFPLKELQFIKNTKIVQETADHVTLIVETEHDEEAVMPELTNIITDMERIFGQGINIDYKLTDHIPRNSSGKFKWLESRI